ncbi:MAG: coenzyme F420-0:L-glutamate ligase [Candidatus Peribacteraceae bacterium]
MQIIPITTRVLKEGDDLAAIFKSCAEFRAGDIIVVSSKAVATVEGAMLDLSKYKPTSEARKLAVSTGHRSPQFIQAVLEETERLHGRVTGACPGALLTEVKPDGLPHGTILTANAGLDESNVPEGFAVGWPVEPVSSVKELQKQLRTALILSDSNCRPRRLGVAAFALVCAGLEPLRSEAGKEDLFGKKLHITTEALADQLATAANFVMGNAGQSVPAAIIRDHGLPPSDFCGWVPGIEPEEDLFRGII